MIRKRLLSLVVAALQLRSAWPTISAALQNVVGVLVSRYNVSISIAVKLHNGEEFTAATGHIKGQNVTPISLIPAGSATKTFTAVGLLRLADAGILDLDTPIVDIIDPWHAKQSIPSLREVFSDAANISKVTTKQLLGMKSGIADYNNSEMFDWTLKHPDKDYLPFNYISDVAKKPFLFKPDDAKAYSSNGYVLAGMVLAAMTGASTWDALDQMSAVGLVDGVVLQNTIFMGRGRCSKHKNVTHQYALKGHAEAEWELERLLPKGYNVGTCAAESDRMVNAVIAGPVLRRTQASSYEECCEKASSSPGMAFSYEGNTCTVLWRPQRAYRALGAISGWTVQHFSAASIIDLYNFSCLNGWTMGNVALAPIDAVKFWHAVFVSKSLVKHESLDLMMSFGDLSHGWGNGMDYGYGLLRINSAVGIRTKGPCPEPMCVHCQNWNLTTSCLLNLTMIGHMGADWGSSMPVNGWIPELRASVAFSLTAQMRGMNTSLTLHENGLLGLALKCYVFQIILQHQIPRFPDLICPPLHPRTATEFTPKPNILV